MYLHPWKQSSPTDFRDESIMLYQSKSFVLEITGFIFSLTHSMLFYSYCIHNDCVYSYRWCDRGSSDTADTEVGKASPWAHTRVWEAETESTQCSLFSTETTKKRCKSLKIKPNCILQLPAFLIRFFTCTHPANIAWSTWARFFMIRTSFGVESAHWPFCMGLIKRFLNSPSEPRRFFLMKLTMQWSVGAKCVVWRV